MILAGLEVVSPLPLWRFYRLADGDTAPAIRQSLEWARSSLRENAVMAKDQKALRTVCKKNLEVLSACYKT